MTLHIAALVEGQGEQAALPNLLNRIWWQWLGATELLRVVDPPLRKKRGQILQQTHLGGFVNDAVGELRYQAQGDPDARMLVLILIDSEGACPAALGPQLLGWARTARPDIDVACVLAHHMYETWFAASASSLAGFNGMPTGLTIPADPEGTGRGKGWVESRLRGVQSNRKYLETSDQPRFSQRMDLNLCHAHSRSFRKLCKELEVRLLPP